jgi:hypothetical protein
MIASAVLAAISSSALGQQSDFHWARSGSPLSEQVHAAFANELAPDRDDPQSHTVPMTLKVVHRVGLRGNSALVLIGEKENKTSPYVVYRAFSFDLQAKTKVPVRSKDAEWFWMWRLEKVAHLESADDTDILFHFLTCTECEATQMLADFHYSTSSGTWEIRQWSEEDGAGLMIGDDVQYGEDGFYYTDCLHAIRDLTGKGLDEVAIRCQEKVQPDPKQPLKRVTRDEMLLYTTARDGKLTRVVIGETSEYAAVRAALCATKPNSPLCRKPRVSPNKSGLP